MCGEGSAGIRAVVSAASNMALPWYTYRFIPAADATPVSEAKERLLLTAHALVVSTDACYSSYQTYSISFGIFPELSKLFPVKVFFTSIFVFIWLFFFYWFAEGFFMMFFFWFWFIFKFLR